MTSQSENYFDNVGQIYETEVDSVDPNAGVVGTALTSSSYRDLDGNIIERTQPNGPVTKSVYNGLDEVTIQYITDGGGGTSYSAASSVSSDIVLSQIENTYDPDENVIETMTSDRLPTASGTGPLGTATTGVYARVSFTGNYFDAVNRLTATVDMGTNGGSSWTTIQRESPVAPARCCSQATATTPPAIRMR